MIELVAQNAAIGYVIIALGIGLGLLAVCIPRPRKQFDPNAGKVVKTTAIRHSAAGSLQQQSKYGQRRSQ